MEQSLRLHALKKDIYGLIKFDGIKYGVLYKGSYWSGFSPGEAVRNLLLNFPRYRFKKEQRFLYVAQMEEIIPGLWSYKLGSEFIPFDQIDIKEIRNIINEDKLLRKAS